MIVFEYGCAETPNFAVDGAQRGCAKVNGGATGGTVQRYASVWNALRP